ncbi:hypothetical protein OY671_008965, partial [Metschnikowia pulcherrima]
PASFVRDPARPSVSIVFYRSYSTAHDSDPFAASHAAFTQCGLDTSSIFVPSSKAPTVRARVDQWVRALSPDAIINATAFSARGEDGDTPLDGAGVPVFQLASATCARAAWAGTARGSSPADLAMHVVSPEIDGSVFAGVASFKEGGARAPDSQFARAVHRADPERIAAIAARVAGWVASTRKPVGGRRGASVSSTYRGKTHERAHAGGVGARASAEAILGDRAQAGYAADSSVRAA